MSAEETSLSLLSESLSESVDESVDESSVSVSESDEASRFFLLFLVELPDVISSIVLRPSESLASESSSSEPLRDRDLDRLCCWHAEGYQ
jgi:hypothetical protein